MKRLNIIHLGLGQVGRNLVEQIMKTQDQLRDKYLISLIYCGLFNSSGGYYDREGYTKDQLLNILNQLENSKQNKKSNDEILNIVDEMHQPFILIDTTASEKTFPIIFSVLAQGGFAVLSNKKPLTLRQEQFDLLQQLGKGRLFCETTVGAGLPVISTLKELLETGDEIIDIKGCFSGTLGYIFSSLDRGQKFSEAVLAAKKLGFTEPDPRDDLSGLDVARKTLILARIMGQKMELSDIKLEKLYKNEMAGLPVDKFLQSIKKLDDEYEKKFEVEKNRGKTLRYVASISKNSCRVGMESVDKDSDLGSLNGPDNMVVFKTKRYFDHPLVIKGPGAGVEVTAAGVFGDILQIAGVI